MFKRPRHNKILSALAAMNAEFMRDAGIYFGGGTAITMMLDEYRESVDMDFLCADRDGYSRLRSTINNVSLGELFSAPVTLAREVTTQRDKVHTFIKVEDVLIKMEIILEGRIEITGGSHPLIPVPCLSQCDLFAEKLLANADRGADKSTMSRDVIDLMMMQARWGTIPGEAWDKVTSVYGESAAKAFKRAKERLLDDPRHLDLCLRTMGIDPHATGSTILRELRRPAFTAPIP